MRLLWLITAVWLGVSSTSLAMNSDGERIGVFFGSYGDVDSKDELKDFMKGTMLDPDIVPVPSFLRKAAAETFWLTNKKRIIGNYEKIGFHSGMREVSQKQVDRVVDSLTEMGFDARGYYGFNLTFPYISDSLDRAREDGVEKLVVMHQGAQYSKVTTGILIRDVKSYLQKHPEWDVQVIAIRSFSKDPRFVKLVGDGLERLIKERELVDNVKPHIFLPIHGVPKKHIKEGDPYFSEVMHVLKALQYRFRDYHISYGFQNHGESAFSKWTGPNEHKTIEELAPESCTNVLIYGRISYTVDFFNTKFEMAIEQKEHIEEHSREYGLSKNVYVAKMFNDEPLFVKYLAKIVSEALIGVGDLEHLQ